MKWIITGTRFGREDFDEIMDRLLFRYGAPTVVIGGDEPKGVDHQCEAWCQAKGIHYVKKRVNRALGSPAMFHSRNQEMADEGNEDDICVAFPHPTKASNGTRDCARRCQNRNLKVRWE